MRSLIILSMLGPGTWNSTRLNDERAKTVALEEGIARLERGGKWRLRRLAKAERHHRVFARLESCWRWRRKVS